MLFLPKVWHTPVIYDFWVKSYCILLQRMLQQQQHGFHCSCACLGGGFGKLNRQYLHELNPWSSALQGHPEPWSKVEKRRGSTTEAQATAFHHTGCRYTNSLYYYNLQTAVAAMERLWCWSDAEVEFHFIPVEVTDMESAWIWSIKHSVRKVMKGQRWLSTVDRLINCVSAAD